MKVTYIENLPLDGAGTMLSPAYKWLPRERVEFCDSITKAGNLWYMMRGGYVHHSIDPTKIKRIENGVFAVEITHNRLKRDFPYSVSVVSDKQRPITIETPDFECIIDIFN